MTEVTRANGHRLDGILPLGEPPMPGPQPTDDDVAFDLEVGLSAVRSLRSKIPADAHSARNLGTEREGNAVLIDTDGTLVTIGYLITEATDIEIGGPNGDEVPAQVVGYDHRTGFGLVRTVKPLDLTPLPIASNVDNILTDDQVVVAASGGIPSAILGHVVDRREFAGSWEYLLDSAIFTAPLHPRWSGGALIDPRSGSLVGIGSLFVQDPGGNSSESQGNMFVPIDLLPPIYQELVDTGRAQKNAKPWLGMQTTEALGHLVVSGVHDGGPADQADLQVGDIIEEIESQAVESLSDMYRKIWSAGGAGADVSISVVRGSRQIDVVIRSGDRHDYLKVQRRH
ncbi:MAG: S1C family serine protease [Alphaproteobacteria bacterium]